MSSLEKFGIPKRFASNKDGCMWDEYAELTSEYDLLDLGLGSPDFEPPDKISRALSQVALEGNYSIHQYTRGLGHSRLVKVLAKMYSRVIKRKLNPFTEIIVSGGAYEGISLSIGGHIDDGDEVILIEPYFDCYEPMIRASNGVPKFIPLRFKDTGTSTSAADLKLDEVELAALFNEKTKAIVLNTPHNPTGKVYSQQELEVIADLCKKWNVLCISDEVYEWMIYDNKEHVRMATLPGMWERTITICSAGKIFGITGWKLGWVYGPSMLLKNLRTVHNVLVNTSVTPMQEALAVILEAELEKFGTQNSHFHTFPKQLQSKRDYLVQNLQAMGLRPLVPHGGYFVLVDWSPLEGAIDLSNEKDAQKDFRFTKWMVKNVGIRLIPPSAFCTDANKSALEKFFRCCFVKKDENLRAAVERLKMFCETIKAKTSC